MTKNSTRRHGRPGPDAMIFVEGVRLIVVLLGALMGYEIGHTRRARNPWRGGPPHRCRHQLRRRRCRRSHPRQGAPARRLAVPEEPTRRGLRRHHHLHLRDDPRAHHGDGPGGGGPRPPTPSSSPPASSGSWPDSGGGWAPSRVARSLPPPGCPGSSAHRPDPFPVRPCWSTPPPSWTASC